MQRVKDRTKQMAAMATGCTEVHLPGGRQEHRRAKQTQGKKNDEDDHDKPTNKRNTTKENQPKE